MDNLGQTKLKKKRAKCDPMHEFDRLPPLLRRWVRNAVMPWSPTSVRRLYLKALKNTGIGVALWRSLIKYRASGSVRRGLMDNEIVLERISNLKDRLGYEEKKAKKLGFASLYH